MAKAGRKPLPPGEKWEDKFKKKNVAVANEHAKFLEHCKESGISYTDYFADRIETDPRFHIWKGIDAPMELKDMPARFDEFAESFMKWSEKLEEKIDSLERILRELHESADPSSEAEYEEYKAEVIAEGEPSMGYLKGIK
jgi:hypothetical protein